MFDAASWLNAWLHAYPWPTAAAGAPRALVHEALDLPEDARIELHKESVARLPLLRASDEPYAWHKGGAVYELACRLYGEQLPYAEQDIVALLTSSKHACGHGADVKPPFELAVAWARSHGISPRWIAALREFLDGLKGLRSVKANELKTKGSLVLLLDGGKRDPRRCHSAQFCEDLATLRRVSAPRGSGSCCT